MTKLKHRRGPTTVFRAITEPLWLLLWMDTRYDVPIPVCSQRDGRWGCHVELTAGEAARALAELSKMRHLFPEQYTTITGTALAKYRDVDDLRQASRCMVPEPAGFFYDFSVRLGKAPEWQATFVSWEKLHGPFRPGLG